MSTSYDRVADLLGPDGPLAGGMPGYEQRQQQIDMTRAVAQAMVEESSLFVEAGTGTGKTLAYLLPAALSEKKVIISTGTKNLQEQIFRKDIPLLKSVLGTPFEAVLLKGISNYVCQRLRSHVGDSSDPDLLRILDWTKTTASGDRAELDVPEDSPAWQRVTTTPDARLGPRCPFFDSCFITQARRDAARADIVIVNHHLFFADLALRTRHPGAQVLPPYDVVVFDEAHQVEEVATEHFGVTVSTLRLSALERDGNRALARLGMPDTKTARGLLDNLGRKAEVMFSAVRRKLMSEHRGDGRLSTPEDLFADDERRKLWLSLDSACEALAAHATLRGESDDDEDAMAIARRAQAVRNDLAVLAERQDTHRHVHWSEVRGRSVFLRASPIDVGPLIRQHVVEATSTTVFASATLAVDGTFDYLKQRLDMDNSLATELLLDSPFDHQRQTMLYLPRDLPEPKDQAFAEAALARIEELLAITDGHAFVLFTSHRSLRHAAEALRETSAYPILVQGEAPKSQLLDAFQRKPRSVLLATASFWEGVDVPGRALSLVVLEKLPFTAPSDPLTSARVKKLEEDGGDAFLGYQVPKAALALKQGFGRLIRRRDDRGIVAILDHRILSRGYGRVFLKTLPPATRTSTIEQVRRWWVKEPVTE